MFSGIITHTADILNQQKRPEGLRLIFKRPSQWTDLELGESIATDGVCLTVDNIEDDTYSATLIPQTMQATVFGKKVPMRVNLERSLKVGDRISGHFVQGHADDIGTIEKIEEEVGYKIWITYPSEKRAYIVGKGSITANGVSLTIAEVEPERFSVALVPHTLQETTFGALTAGDIVNLEYDVLGKYVVNAVQEKGSSL